VGAIWVFMRFWAVPHREKLPNGSAEKQWAMWPQKRTFCRPKEGRNSWDGRSIMFTPGVLHIPFLSKFGCVALRSAQVARWTLNRNSDNSKWQETLIGCWNTVIAIDSLLFSARLARLDLNLYPTIFYIDLTYRSIRHWIRTPDA